MSHNSAAERGEVAVVPITDFVDTSRPHNPDDRIRLGEMKRFGKAALGGGRRERRHPVRRGGRVLTDSVEKRF